jgi:hypothetical protein
MEDVDTPDQDLDIEILARYLVAMIVRWAIEVGSISHKDMPDLSVNAWLEVRGSVESLAKVLDPDVDDRVSAYFSLSKREDG